MHEGNGEKKTIGEISSKQQIDLISAQTRTVPKHNSSITSQLN